MDPLQLNCTWDLMIFCVVGLFSVAEIASEIVINDERY